MKTYLHFSWAAFAMLTLLAVFSSCRDDDTEEAVRVSGVKLSPATLELTAGDRCRLQAEVLPANAANRDVAWSCDTPAVAVVDETGCVEALTAGEATVTATTLDGHKTAGCKVTVVAAAVPVERVLVDPATLELTEGDTEQLTATVLPADADVRTVSWSSDRPEVAAVDAQGRVTAIAAGEAIVTAEAGGKRAACTVDVRAREKVTTLYATGYYDRLIYAFSWATGQSELTMLGDESQSTRTNAICVAGGDVYIGGQATTDEQGYFAPTLWKNGAETFLTDPSAPIDGEVLAVAVDGSDVYAGGYYRVNRTETTKFRKDAATVWKNGTPYELTDGTNYAQVRAIAVSGGTVYAAGERTNENGIAVATLWKCPAGDPGSATASDLSDGTNDAYVQSICVDGNDVYAVGYGYGNDRGNYLAMLWKNDEPVQLLSDGHSWAYSVVASGGHLYAAGWRYEQYDGKDCAVATLWKDGTAEALTTEKRSSQARCVFVADDDVYVSGFLGDQAVVWVNGEPLAFTDGTNAAAVTAVFVTKE